MVKFHGTPVSGSRRDVVDFLRGRSIMASWLRADDLNAALAYAVGVLIDNGEYTENKRGGHLDYGAFVDFLTPIARHPRFVAAIIPDKMNGTWQENDALLARWPAHLRGWPVWHPAEPIERAVRLCHAYETVCIGGSDGYDIGQAAWWQRMDEFYDAICDEDGLPPCRLHGLKQLNPLIFQDLPLSSADSVNAVRNAADRDWVKCRPRTAGQRANVLADIAEAHNSAACYVRGKAHWVEQPPRQLALFE